MKILWFSLSPCGSLRRNNTQRVTQGWMISLEDEIKKIKDIELSVAFFSEKKESPFDYENVRYYPMYLGQSRNPIIRVLNRRRIITHLDEKKLKLMKDVVDICEPDIIHSHGTEDSFGLVAPYAESKGIPFVYSIQGLIAPYCDKYFAGVSPENAFRYDDIIQKIRAAGEKQGWKNFKAKADRENEYLREAKYICGRTAWDRNCTLGMNPNRKYFEVNEILRPSFYTTTWKGYLNDGISKQIFLVSTISGGIFKGYETVLKTAFNLKKYSGLNFEWHIAGYGENYKWVRIAEKITGIKSADVNIVLHGLIDAEKLACLLSQSDLYIHVSHIENSPNSVCEAMLVGIPVIASFAGGTSSIVKDGIEGTLVQDGDSYIYAGSIVNSVKNPAKTIEMAKNAKTTATYRHNKEKIIDELMYVYKSIL